MKKSTLGIVNAVTLTALLALAGLSFAQEGQRGEQAEAMFARLDTDQDGQITLEEFETARNNHFTEADENGDGGISRDEMVAAIIAKANQRAARRAEKMADRVFSRHDSDGDGVISAEEIPADQAEKMFARLDANGDGSIVLAEISAMHRGHGGFGKDHSE